MKKVILKFSGHEIGKDLWRSKSDLFKAFMGGFYDFILTHGGKDDLLKKDLRSQEDFLAFASYWCGDEKGCYDLGFAFAKYYLVPNGIVDLAKQPPTAYIGYLYQQNRMRDFLNFLISFFAYWRNDEGCTVFDPYNFGDNFFHSAWAALVDTGKLFCLDFDTVYPWQSFRVKYCLNHIPGVILTPFADEIDFMEKAKLPSLKVAGYRFLGWYDHKQKKIAAVKDDAIVYGKLERRDVYDYWEKEEKTIKKVYAAVPPQVDPE